MDTQSPNKPRKFKRTSACQKANDNGFLGQEMSADGGIHATRDHNNVTNVLRNTKKKLRRAIQNKRRGMLIYGVVLLHDNAFPHTAARTRALMEHFNWELSDYPPYSPDPVPSDYHLLTYQKNWLRSQYFNINEELMEGVKTWLSSQAACFFDTKLRGL
jgi:transposase